MWIIETINNFFFQYYVSSNFIGAYRILTISIILGYFTFIIKDIINFSKKGGIGGYHHKYYYPLCIILFYLFGFLSLIGFVTQFSILLFLIFFIIIQKNMLYILASGGNVICNVLLLFLVLSKSGAGLSVDNIIFNNYEDYVYGWAIRLIQITISFGYFFSGLNKIKSSDWRKGIAISNAVIYSNYGKQKLLTLFYPKTLQSKLICYSVVLFHLFAPILFWCNFTQLFAISFAVLSHLMMMMTLRIGHFGPIMILGILSFGANYFLK